MSLLGRLIGKEAVRAASIWFVLYAGFVGILIAYKLQTRDFYMAEQERLFHDVHARQLALAQERVEAIQQERIAEANAAAEAAAAKKKAMEEKKNRADNDGDGSDLSQYEGELEDILQQLQQKEEETDRLLKDLMEKHTKLDELKQRLETLPFPTFENSNRKGVVVPEASSFQRLVSMANLSEMTNFEELDSLFRAAIEDIHTIHSKRFALNLHDNYLSKLFTASDYPTKETFVVDTSACPERSSTNDVAKAKKAPIAIPSNAAKISDLEQRIRKINVLLDRRQSPDGGMNALLMPESMMSLNRASRTVIEELLEEIVSKSDAVLNARQARLTGQKSGSSSVSSSSSSSSCVNEEQVLELMDEGLLAVMKKSDLRNVLRAKAIQLDSNAQNIILDADLPPVQPLIRPRDTVNLRRVSDTPLLARTSEWIDQLVEICGGYNDQLDNYLDSFGRGRESIGEIVVRRVLDESGKVELPHPKVLAKKLPTPLRSLVGGR